jgi:hypothetical protein
MIEHHDDDSVSFRITAFSRPATRLARIAGPLGAVVQRQITAAYLRSLAKIAVQLARMTSGQSRFRFRSPALLRDCSAGLGCRPPRRGLQCP